ncbi:hypothetical protein V490_01567 [Pseudogymnoascus sp. VKM F-3557]|nr:hypothetical protein V490_01567 [Pseudogymnoascus sp. VKM F-3557]
MNALRRAKGRNLIAEGDSAIEMRNPPSFGCSESYRNVRGTEAGEIATLMLEAAQEGDGETTHNGKAQAGIFKKKKKYTLLIVYCTTLDLVQTILVFSRAAQIQYGAGKATKDER